MDSWEIYAATVILIVSLAVVFMLLQYAAITKTLRETQEIQAQQKELIFQLLGVVDQRGLAEMDLPPEFQPAKGV